jgi:hypothetical protein
MAARRVGRKADMLAGKTDARKAFELARSRVAKKVDESVV